MLNTKIYIAVYWKVRFAGLLQVFANWVTHDVIYNSYTTKEKATLSEKQYCMCCYAILIIFRDSFSIMEFSVKECLCLVLCNTVSLHYNNDYTWYNTCSSWLLIIEHQLFSWSAYTYYIHMSLLQCRKYSYDYICLVCPAPLHTGTYWLKTINITWCETIP